MNQQSKRKEDKSHGVNEKAVDHTMSEPVSDHAVTIDIPQERHIPANTRHVGNCRNCGAPIRRHIDTGIVTYKCACPMYFREHC